MPRVRRRRALSADPRPAVVGGRFPLFFPGYLDRMIPVTVGAGEILSVDGQMAPE